MKTRRQLFAVALVVAISLAAAPMLTGVANAQSQQYGAIERGYRTGYSDGFQAGWGDQLRRANSDYRSKQDYQSADRAYINAYGALEDYRDGYQQGYESGYESGYNRRGFDSELPTGGITRRGATPRETAQRNGTERGGRADDADESSSQSRSSNDPGRADNVGGSRSDASDIFLLVELRNRLSTDVSQRGDRFEAEVIEPQEYAGATVAGQLADVRRPGKAKGTALLQIDFDKIRMPGGDWQDFSAQVVEVIPSSPDSNVGEVDAEGGVRGKGTTKEDAVKVGAGAGIGAIIGGIAGGGKGAVIGAVIGGGAGTAGAAAQRGKDIRLEQGQQLRIRTASRPR